MTQVPDQNLRGLDRDVLGIDPERAGDCLPRFRRRNVALSKVVGLDAELRLSVTPHRGLPGRRRCKCSGAAEFIPQAGLMASLDAGFNSPQSKVSAMLFALPNRR